MKRKSHDRNVEFHRSLSESILLCTSLWPHYDIPIFVLFNINYFYIRIYIIGPGALHRTLYFFVIACHEHATNPEKKSIKLHWKMAKYIHVLHLYFFHRQKHHYKFEKNKTKSTKTHFDSQYFHFPNWNSHWRTSIVRPIY